MRRAPRRRTVAGFAIACCCAVASPALPSPQVFARAAALTAAGGVPLVVEGVRRGRVATLIFHGRLFLSLDGVARAANVSVKGGGTSRAVRVDGEDVAVRAGDVRLVRASGDAELVAAPISRDGTLFVATADLASIFEAIVERKDGAVYLWGAVASEPLAVKDVALPSAEVARRDARRAAAPIPKTIAASAPPLVRGTFTASLLRAGIIGAEQRASLQAAGESWNIDAALWSGPAERLVAGTLRLGNAQRGVALGEVPDPLAGAIFGSRAVAGAALYAPWGTFGESHALGGSTLMGGSLNLPAATSLRGGLLTDKGFTPIAGVARVAGSASRSLDEELWASAHGVAVGARDRWDGPIFGTLAADLAGAGLPIAPLDRGIRAEAGARLWAQSAAFAGIAARPGGRSRGYVGASLRARGASLAARVGPGDVELAGTVASAWANGSLRWSNLHGAGSLFATAALRRRRGTCDAEADMSSPVRSFDVLAECSYPAGRIEPLLGVDARGSAHLVEPVVGLRLPALPTLTLDVTTQPGPRGAQLRVRVSQRFVVAAPPPVMRVTVTGAGESGARLFVDGTAYGTLRGTRVTLPLGEHRIWLRSRDGTRGSIAALVDASNRTADLALVPLRDVRGTIRFDDAGAHLIAPFLGGIAVTLVPAGVTVLSDDDGGFSFPSVPVGPGATVRLNAEDLPSGVTAAAPSAPADGAPVIVVTPKQKIERTRF